MPGDLSHSESSVPEMGYFEAFFGGQLAIIHRQGAFSFLIVVDEVLRLVYEFRQANKTLHQIPDPPLDESLMAIPPSTLKSTLALGQGIGEL